MIYITGDTHIPIDISKLNSKNFSKQKQLKKDDYLIICGDFGGVWDNGKEELYWRKWLEQKSFTTLFVDGNHENFDLLEGFETVDAFGSRVGRISDSIYHLKRGHIYTVDNKRIFTFGGASSHDRGYRQEGISWWRQEMPSLEEMQKGLSSLLECNNEVDLIITHSAPTSVQRKINPAFSSDALTDYLEEIKNTISFDSWYFGHYHTDTVVDGRFYCMYEKIKEYK